MVKITTKSFTFLIATILFISLVSATFTKGNLSYSIDKLYGPGETIRGWVNISLDSQSSGSVMESSLDENSTISLIDLIKTDSNTGFIYECKPLSCASDYSGSSEGISKTFDIGENESALFGFNLSGKKDVSDITSFTMNVMSNNPETEKFPLSIDFLDDGQKEWQAYSASDSFGIENLGCFVGVATSQAFISQTPYCEVISLAKSPRVEIGTYVSGEGSVYFEMRIEKADGSGAYKTCTASASGSGVQRIGCVPADFAVNEKGNYFVCVKTIAAADINKYEIEYEEKNTCGFTGDYTGMYDYDFEIFARPKRYTANTNFTLNNAELAKAQSPVTDIEEYMKNYIAQTYNNNCSKGCIIPVRIFSGIKQQIKFTNLSLTYASGVATITNKFYNLQEKPAEISSGFQKLYLDEAEFKVPEDYGNHSISISLDGANLLSEDEEIFVMTVATVQSLVPRKTAVKYPTRFIVTASSIGNITGYRWNFGDGSAEITGINSSATHTYSSIGSYIINISITDISGKISSGWFNVSVGPASEIVPSLLNDAEKNLNNIKNYTAHFSAFEQKGVNNALNLDGIREKITQLKGSASTATYEQEYEMILGELLLINLPETVAKTAVSEQILFYPEDENINLEILEKISGSSYDKAKEDQYKEAILSWVEANAATMLIYSEISASYNGQEKSLLKVFNIKVIKETEDDAYLAIKKIKDLSFEADYSQKEDLGYEYIILKEKETEISFSTTENVDFVSLPMFVSPGISKLVLTEVKASEEEKKSKKGTIFTIIIISVILLAIGAWIFLQIWYKRKYENYLFKDRNQLYNLVNFIEVEKEKGTEEKEISAKLKKSGWNSEQITYALKKYKGKRTGMPEIIPIEKIFSALKDVFNKLKTGIKIKSSQKTPNKKQ